MKSGVSYFPPRVQTQTPQTREASPPSWLAPVIALGALLAFPLRVLDTGYLPQDDALRHAAKAISGKTWAEILVLRPDGYVGFRARMGFNVELMNYARQNAFA